jgi:hypothetical protein
MNRAMALVDPEAVYCKPLMADDWLFPECIEKMIGEALADPGIGLVCCYAFNGRQVLFDSIHSVGGVVSLVSGRGACRASLLDEDVYFFGSPTTALIRADLVRKRSPFYNPLNLHADEESCYDILQESEFCFVHQILAFCRDHSQSQTSQVRQLGSIMVGRIYSLLKYGPVYLSADELERRSGQRFREYYDFLAQSALRRAPGKFWRYHHEKLALLGAPLNRGRLLGAILRRIVRRPLTSLRDLFR